LVLTACAASRTTPPGHLVTPQPASSESEPLVDVVEVDVNALANADSYECRKRAPTGTRIAVEQCDPTASAGDAVAHEQMLRDIEALQRQHWQLEAARQNAFGGVPTSTPAPSAPSPQP
jgi:hypothetical protein